MIHTIDDIRNMETNQQYDWKFGLCHAPFCYKTMAYIPLTNFHADDYKQHSPSMILRRYLKANSHSSTSNGIDRYIISPLFLPIFVA